MARKQVYAWRGRFRARLHDTIFDLDSLVFYNNKQPTIDPYSPPFTVGQLAAIATLRSELVALLQVKIYR